MDKNLQRIEQAQAASKMSLEELSEEGGTMIRMKIPPTLKKHIVSYQKAFHKRHGYRINKEMLMHYIIQRSLIHLARKTNEMELEYQEQQQQA